MRSLEHLFQKDIESTEDGIPAFQEPVEMQDMEESASIDLPDWLKGVDEVQKAISQLILKFPLLQMPWNSLIIPEETPSTPGADDEILAGDEIWPIENLVTEESGEFLTKSELESPEEILTSTDLEGEDVQVPVEDKESDFEKSESTQEQPVVVPVEEIDTLKEQVDIEEILLDSSTRIQQKQDLEGVIITLENITQTHPGETQVWQTLGDAYFKNNQIQQAIDAYTKAEETLQ